MRYLILLVLFLLLTSNLPAHMVTEDHINRINEYLATFQNVQAEFIQEDSLYGISKGSIIISKPNKVRIDYQEPRNAIITARGNTVTYYDSLSDQISNIKNIHFQNQLIMLNAPINAKDKNIKSITYDNQLITITLNNTDGETEVIFTEDPIHIKAIINKNKLDQETAMYFSNHHYNIKINKNIFHIINNKNEW